MDKVILERTFNLRDDVTYGVGTTIQGNFPKRYYGLDDVTPIEKSIYYFIIRNMSEYAQKHSGVTEDDIEIDLTLYGKLNESMLTVLTLDVEKWDEIYGVKYIKPGSDTVRLLPRNYDFEWM